MALTKPFSDTVAEWVRKDRKFRRALLCEALNEMLRGDLSVAKALLRDYVNGTIGFVGLEKLMGKSSKSLMRMLSSKGNPSAQNLADLLRHLQEQTGVKLALKA